MICRWVSGAVVSIVVGSLAIVAGCGPAQAEVSKKSVSEMRLGVGLREENNIPGAIQHLTKATEIDSSNAEAQLQLGHLYLTEPEFQDMSKAELHLKSAIEIASDEEQTRQGVIPDARTMLGALYINQTRYAEAEKALNDAAGDIQNSQPHFALGNLGWAYLKQGKNSKALSVLTKAVRIQPRFCVGHFRLGQAYFAEKDFESAEQSLTRALEVDQRCGEFFQDAWKLRGETRTRLGLRDEAVADFERCVEIDKETKAGRSCARQLNATK